MKAMKLQKTESNTKLLAVIRIEGMVHVKPDAAATLDKLRLRRKYACVLINGADKQMKGMLDVVKFHVAYGEVDKDILVQLLQKRGKSIEGDKRPLKMNAEEVAEQLMNGKKLADLGMKPFFRLHPPRKGIHSKLQYPKGVLGNNGKNINKLIERML